MENKNKYLKTGFSTILWAVMVVLLFAAPCVQAVIYNDKGTHSIVVDPGESLEIRNGTVVNISCTVTGAVTVSDTGSTVNLWPGADISLYLYAKGGSKVNICGGDVYLYILVAEEIPSPVVTVYGTAFALNGNNLEPIPAQLDLKNTDTLTVTYTDGLNADLWFISSIPIYVGTVEQLIEQLIGYVEALNLKQGIDNSLDAKLQNTLSALEAANAGQRQDAVNKMQAYISAVEAQSGKAISEAGANALIGSAQLIIDLLLAG